MGANSAIEWTDATFNPWWGCVRVSPGCEHCYAETLAKRYGHDVWGPSKTTGRRTFGEKHWNEPLRWNRAAEKAGERARVFCASMADVFEEHPALTEERAKLWALIERTPWLDWLLLTKRPENVARMLGPNGVGAYAVEGPVPCPQPNVWIGCSVEDQQRAEERIPHLLTAPAAIRFLSCEPLLGPVDLRGPLGLGQHVSDVPDRAGNYDVAQGSLIDWIIIGGESGPGARPAHLAWIDDLRDQAQAADVALFVKQLGRSLYRDSAGHRERWFPRDPKGGDWSEWPEDLRVREFPASTPGAP